MCEFCSVYIQEKKMHSKSYNIDNIFSVDELFNLFAGKPYQTLFKCLKKMSTIGFNTCLADLIKCKKSGFTPILPRIKLECKLDMF